MAVMILDPELERWVTDELVAEGDEWERLTETWDGVTVVSPIPNNEHQALVGGLYVPLYETVLASGLGYAAPGANIASQTPNWKHDHRGPDVVAYLHTNPAVDCGTHWVGGPDFLVEIISPGEKRGAKLGFYASVNTREVLIVDRNPWQLELFTLVGGAIVSTGIATLAAPAILTSAALGLTFDLIPGPTRPQVRVTHSATGRTWLA